MFYKLNNLQKIYQVGLGISFTGQFTHISFVNSIHTSRGGAHVNYIADQVSKYLLDQVKKKDKELKLNVNHIKVKFLINEFYVFFFYYRIILLFILIV